MLSVQVPSWSVSYLHIANSYCRLTIRPTAMYQFYQVFLCLLKFDFFCFVGVTMQVCTSLLVILYQRGTEGTLTAPHRRSCRQFCRVWNYHCCYSCGPFFDSWLCICCSARNQMVWSFTLYCLSHRLICFRMMSTALALMIPCMTYCKAAFYTSN